MFILSSVYLEPGEKEKSDSVKYFMVVDFLEEWGTGAFLMLGQPIQSCLAGV